LPEDNWRLNAELIKSVIKESDGQGEPPLYWGDVVRPSYAHHFEVDLNCALLNLQQKIFFPNFVLLTKGQCQQITELALRTMKSRITDSLAIIEEWQNARR